MRGKAMSLSLLAPFLIALLFRIGASSQSPVLQTTDDRDGPPSGGVGLGTVSSSIFGDDYLRKVEAALQESYGGWFSMFALIITFLFAVREVEFFRRMIADFEMRYADDTDMELNDPKLESHITHSLGKEFMRHYSSNNIDEMNPEHRTARALVMLIKEQFRALDEVHEMYVKPHLDRFSQIRALSQRVSLRTDTPCSTQAGCDGLEMLINLCTSIRGGVHKAYEIFVIMVHVLGTMMAVLCGCLFVGPARICFLQNFPYTCRIPFPVFSGLFQGTISVWQVVKVVTNVCRIYGDPGFGSVFA
ncbi:uncharacterized protein BcabD6B2_54050 [Babesia caballi]|uniref:Membrane protein, putative n=1 Tax=Babesia caballi TaxID=5871 RepID=A0AAV4M561_BABCB|nr:membrane protein, putative [Babesia caballi]